MAATVAASMHRIEIVSDRRRAYDPAFRAQVVAESRAPGARVRQIARRHGICASLIYRWRREGLDATAPSLLPARVMAEPRQGSMRCQEPAAPMLATDTSNKPASIEIEFADGVRIRVDETISQAALRRVVAVLRG
jgi:transposase